MATFRMFEYLTIEVTGPSTKQLLNNFWGRFFRKAKTKAKKETRKTKITFQTLESNKLLFQYIVYS